jgi:WD40 repeat protein
MFLAHGRPISGITFAADNRTVITSSWDANLVIWDLTHDFEGHTLSGHRDIVAGCRLTPDGQTILSWSYDGTLVLWSMARREPFARLSGHQDRVTAASISPDGRLAVSGSRDGSLKLWDITNATEVAAVDLAGEVRACFFFRHGKSLAAVQADGRLTVHSAQDLAEMEELQTDLQVVCAELAPAGNRIVLGCDDGLLRFVEVEESERFPLIVTVTKTSRRTSTRLQRILGRSHIVQAYLCTCPVCRHSFELPRADTAETLPCPRCRRGLRISDVLQTTGADRSLSSVAR